VFPVETAPGIQSILYLWESRGARVPACYNQPPAAADLTLYVPHLSSECDIVEDECPVRVALLYSVDVRGMGRSAPRTCGLPLMGLVGPDMFYACHSLMLGESLLGDRVHDLLVVLDLLRSLGARRVHLVGRGLGALTATYAACLHPVVSRVTLRHALRSYRELLGAAAWDWPLSSLPWGALKRFDLPDCYRLLRGKGLRMIEPWGPHWPAASPGPSPKRKGKP
jgi:pimeloyl-ACP methyl ester carboxylesterase